MTNNLSISKIIIGLIVIGIIGYLIGGQISKNGQSEAVVANDTVEVRETVTNNGTEVEEMDKTTTSGQEMPNTVPDTMAEAKPGTYTDYNPALLANAESGDVLLFFHAKWCPSCRGLEKDIEESLGDIPANVTILHVDYDTATELKKKYGVVRQHTLVRVDANGDKIETLTGLTNTLEQVVAQL